MKRMMMKMGALQLAAVAAAMAETGKIDSTPCPRVDVSRPSTLSSKELKRRKTRNKLARRSRRQNRR